MHATPTDEICENCEEPATCVDNPEDGNLLCSSCKEDLNAAGNSLVLESDEVPVHEHRMVVCMCARVVENCPCTVSDKPLHYAASCKYCQPNGNHSIIPTPTGSFDEADPHEVTVSNL